MKQLSLFFYLLFLSACTNLVTTRSGIGDLKLSVESVENSEDLLMRINGKLFDSALTISSYKIDYNKDIITIEIERVLGGKGYNGPYDIQFLVPRHINKVVLGKSEIIWSRMNN